jgi:hypothetical protein
LVRHVFRPCGFSLTLRHAEHIVAKHYNMHYARQHCVCLEYLPRFGEMFQWRKSLFCFGALICKFSVRRHLFHSRRHLFFMRTSLDTVHFNAVRKGLKRNFGCLWNLIWIKFAFSHNNIMPQNFLRRNRWQQYILFIFILWNDLSKWIEKSLQI